jgi:hypothetical protein
MKKTVTRKEILQAIRYEPLAAGNWIRTDSKDPATCEVCAVGGVLRRAAGLSPYDIEDFGYQLLELSDCIFDRENSPTFNSAAAFAKALVKDGLYLNALSVYFESLHKRYGGGTETRKRLRTFVKNHFPKVVPVTLSAYEGIERRASRPNEFAI